MRGKRSGVPVPALTSFGSQSSAKDDDSASDNAIPSSSISPFSNKRAADMFAAYNNANMSFDGGSGLHSGDAPSAGNAKQGATGGSSMMMTDIKDGAERLANELDDYLSRGANKPFFRTRVAPTTPLSDEAVADLQLATARKLREVGLTCVIYSYTGM